MTAIVTITCLLPVVCAVYQELELISELNTFFNFDHNIFLLDSSADTTRLLNTSERGEIIPQSVHVIDNDSNSNGWESLTEIKSKNTFMIVAPANANLDKNFNLLKRVKEIQRLQMKMRIGIFFMDFISKEELLKLFKWFKEHLIVNIFAATFSQARINAVPNQQRCLNIFSFNPFGPFDVINVTGSVSIRNFFPSLDSNFQQHELRLAHNTWFRYCNVEMWVTIIDIMNASYIEREKDDMGSNEIYEKGIDIVPRLYTQASLSEVPVYPSIIEPVLILVPKALPYSGFSAYLQTVTSDKFFTFSLIAIAAVMFFLNIFRYINQKKSLFFQSVADVLNLLMNDNGHIKYQRLSRNEVLIIVPLTFVGFIIVNGILSNLKSHLTRPILQHQINTWKEIYESPFPILTCREEWKTSLDDTFTRITKHNSSDRIVVLEEDLCYEEIDRYNRSISIVTSSSHANMLLRIQRRLNKRVYHNPQIRLFNYLLTYNVNEKFIFFERLNEIMHRIHSAGLFDLWWRKDYSELEKSILKTVNLKKREEFVQKFEFPTFILYGWIASVIVLVIEICWNKFQLLWLKK